MRKTFTLLEVLVTIAIIGVLSLLLYPIMNELLAVVIALLIITVPLAVTLLVVTAILHAILRVMDAWDYLTGPH